MIIYLLFCISIIISADFVSPPFYKGLDGPTYDSNSTLIGNIETRTYEGQTWISTNVPGNDINVAIDIGYKKLVAYFSGKNDLGIVINMTTPALSKIQPPSDPTQENTYLVSFYAPYIYQKSPGPPEPLDKSVYIRQGTPIYVAIKSYQGIVTEKRNEEELKVLTEEVELVPSISIDNSSSAFFYVGYDPFLRSSDCYNEVWIRIMNKRTNE